MKLLPALQDHNRNRWTKASSEGLMNVGQTLGVSLKVSDNKEAAMAHQYSVRKITGLMRRMLA